MILSLAYSKKASECEQVTTNVKVFGRANSITKCGDPFFILNGNENYFAKIWFHDIIQWGI